MSIYIRSTGNVSPQKTFGTQPFLTELVNYTTNQLRCIEPDYKDIIDVKLIRRMSRIIKMGVAAAHNCLQSAGIQSPDAIVTGTAYGCLEDTGNFLTKLIVNKEEFLTPTAFIQSTHNTVGGQIALMVTCHGYNNTFVHRGFSFENALLDAQLLIADNEAQNVLVGSVDEITDFSHTILSRFDLYKKEPVNSVEILHSSTKGTVAGEGASFFLLTDEVSADNEAKLNGFATLYKPSGLSEIQNFITSFLQSNNTSIGDIDLIILGKNGDVKTDTIYDKLSQSMFENKTAINFKHLCGEYPTASSFALWMATNIIKTKAIPKTLVTNAVNENKIGKILIYNHYQNTHHSLFLVSAC